MKYDAFISYAHRVDSVRATALQRALAEACQAVLEQGKGTGTSSGM